MPQLSCQDLTLGYEGKVIIANLSFAINSGDYLCIVGENGSGKSTLMKTLLHLKTPLSGRIVKGNGLTPNDMGYLPQQSPVQKDFPASVKEIVLSGCLNRCGFRPFYNKEEKRIADEYMEKLGIFSLAKRCYRELSGGQQQRTLLARALCSAKKMLFLDEPAAGLDPKAATELYALIQKLNDSGMTIVMISHDLTVSLTYASHILHIGTPSSLFFGKTEDYKASQTGRIYAGLEGRQT